MATVDDRLFSGAAQPTATLVDSASDVRDFWTLLKPNVMQLVVFTGMVGLYLAPGHLHPVLAFTAILCIAVGAGAAAAINNWFDADIDRLMVRTRRRPTATGRILPEEALATGIVLAVLSVGVMGLALNWLAAGLLALTIAFYVLVYTMWLKRRTPQNIVIGGAAGALPPLVAWACVTGRVDLMPLLLFAIIFLWTPPHFWALALYRSGDYDRVGVPMLPVVAGRPTTLRHIMGYTVVLFGVSMGPWLAGDLGSIYAAAAMLLGLAFMGSAARLWQTNSDIQAMRTFKVSLAYLALLFAAMVLDRLVANLGLLPW